MGTSFASTLTVREDDGVALGPHRQRGLAVDDAVRCEDAVDVVRERRLRLKELDATLNGLTGGRWGDATYRDAPVAPAPKQTSSDPAPSEPTP